MRLVKILLLCALWVPWAPVASPLLPQTGGDIIERALEATGSLTMGGSTFEASMKYFNVRPDKPIDPSHFKRPGG